MAVSQIPGEIVDVIAIRRDYLQQNAATVEQLLKAWFEAVQYIYEFPDEAANIMSLRMHISPDEVKQSLKGLDIPSYEENLHFLSGEQAELLVTMGKLNRVMLKHQLIDRQVYTTSVVFPGALQGLHQ